MLEAGWDGGGARPDPHLRQEHATPVPSFGTILLGPHTAWGSLWKEASSAVRVPPHFAPDVGTDQHAVAVGNGLQSWLARARRLLCKTWSSVTAFMRLFRVVRICSEALLPPPQCQPLAKHGRAFAPMSGRGALGDAILRAYPQSGQGPRSYCSRSQHKPRGLCTRERPRVPSDGPRAMLAHAASLPPCAHTVGVHIICRAVSVLERGRVCRCAGQGPRLHSRRSYSMPRGLCTRERPRVPWTSRRAEGHTP